MIRIRTRQERFSVADWPICLPVSYEDRSDCEGYCEEHRGDVRLVEVSSPTWAPMKFRYCKVAVAEDRRRGFTVRQVTEEVR